MVAGFEGAAPSGSRAAVGPLEDWRERAGLPRTAPPLTSESASQFQPIATPVSFGGFTERTLEVFGDRFRRLGLRPLQGAGGGLRDDSGAPLEPGSMISVGLIRGDMTMDATGTITHNRWRSRAPPSGHRFMSAGDTQMPMMRASVMTLVPNLNASFKLSGTGSLIGQVSMDREAGIAGRLGPGPAMVPCKVRIISTDGGMEEYSFEVVRDNLLTPMLLETALFSSINVTERSLGPLTIRVRGNAVFTDGLPGLVLDDIYTGEAAVGEIAALSTVAPLAYLLQTGHAGVEVESVDLESGARAR